MVLWGICMVTMGLTHNFQGMMAARFFLGVAEAGLFPGINYYLSSCTASLLARYEGNAVDTSRVQAK